MGEAKRRGTKEERVARGVVKREAREKERQERRARIWAAMTPQEKSLYRMIQKFGKAPQI